MKLLKCLSSALSLIIISTVCAVFLSVSAYSETLEFRVMHIVGLGYVSTIKHSDAYTMYHKDASASEPSNAGWEYLAYSRDHKTIHAYTNLGNIKLAKTRGHAIRTANLFAKANGLVYPFIVEWSTASENPTKGSDAFEKFTGKVFDILDKMPIEGEK